MENNWAVSILGSRIATDQEARLALSSASEEDPPHLASYKLTCPYCCRSGNQAWSQQGDPTVQNALGSEPRTAKDTYANQPQQPMAFYVSRPRAKPRHLRRHTPSLYIQKSPESHGQSGSISCAARLYKSSSRIDTVDSSKDSSIPGTAVLPSPVLRLLTSHEQRPTSGSSAGWSGIPSPNLEGLGEL
ncbi:hypothetical protein BP5796_10428 [Coleophoma crateriformis]|uniref:Uncharacterized protein n=1 Tax=Coleophoma crateriformis TaxID=565419 RepID=A0A3D8QQ24_9HELO|nr:hypothetical protein BP5796_10428 [Coleophoma crateriformis]